MSNTETMNHRRFMGPAKERVTRKGWNKYRNSKGRAYNSMFPRKWASR